MQFPDLQHSPLEIQRAYQTKQLTRVLAYAAQHSPFYQRRWAEVGIEVDRIRTLEDLRQLPFTSKQDLQAYNGEFISVERRQLVDYVTTSGTMGDPVVVALTDGDLDRLAYNERSSFETAGLTADDTLLLTTTLDRRFMAGLAYFLGARALGAGVVRVGSGLPALQWDTIERVQPTVIVAVPSFLLKLIEYAKEAGIDYQNSSIRKAICIGEALRREDFSLTTLGLRIVEQWDLQLHSTYASTEMSTAFTECEAGQGGHHNPALLIVEVLDEAGQPVGEGELGEVVVTTLHVEGMPLVRFRTGDLCRVYQTPCSCGRTSLRLGPVVGRKGQMIKYKGTTLYPPALYDLLTQIKEVEGFVIEVYTNDLGTDEICLNIHSYQAHSSLKKRLKDYCRAHLRVMPQVVFLEAKALNALRFPAMSRKPVLFIDRRK